MKLFQARMVYLTTKEKNKKNLRSSRKYFKREKVVRLVYKIRMFNVIFVDKQVTNNNFINNAKTRWIL